MASCEGDLLTSAWAMPGLEAAAAHHAQPRHPGWCGQQRLALAVDAHSPSWLRLLQIRRQSARSSVLSGAVRVEPRADDREVAGRLAEATFGDGRRTCGCVFLAARS